MRHRACALGRPQRAHRWRRPGARGALGTENVPAIAGLAAALSEALEVLDAKVARIEDNDMFVIPKPLSQDRLEQILLEHGLVGAA